jgi:hypothetical protein
VAPTVHVPLVADSTAPTFGAPLMVGVAAANAPSTTTEVEADVLLWLVYPASLPVTFTDSVCPSCAAAGEKVAFVAPAMAVPLPNHW